MKHFSPELFFHVAFQNCKPGFSTCRHVMCVNTFCFQYCVFVTVAIHFFDTHNKTTASVRMNDKLTQFFFVATSTLCMKQSIRELLNSWRDKLFNLAVWCKLRLGLDFWFGFFLVRLSNLYHKDDRNQTFIQLPMVMIYCSFHFKFCIFY